MCFSWKEIWDALFKERFLKVIIDWFLYKKRWKFRLLFMILWFQFNKKQTFYAAFSDFNNIITIHNISCDVCQFQTVTGLMNFRKNFTDLMASCNSKEDYDCVKNFVTINNFRTMMTLLFSGISNMIGTLHAGNLLPLDGFLRQVFDNMVGNNNSIMYPPILVLYW